MCNFRGCKRKATHGLKVTVPAQGWSLDEHTPLEVFISLELCHTHAVAAKIDTVMLPEAKDEVARMLEIHKRAKPDWDRARIGIVRLDSTEWAAWEKHRAGKTH